MADQYTIDLLTKWGCTPLIDTFRDAKIDAVALGLLKENDITSLIPIIGDRVKFDANLSMWKADNQLVNVGDSSQISDLVTDGNFSGIIYELQVETFVVQSEQTPHPDRDKIMSILNNTHRGRALLSSPQAVSGLLDSSQRKELANLLLDSVLEANPNTQIKWSDFQSWARGIGELFKKESPALYYAAYIALRAIGLRTPHLAITVAVEGATPWNEIAKLVRREPLDSITWSYFYQN